MKKLIKKKCVVLTAGGTGGHVYPADALAEELEKRNYDVVLYTDSRGLNNYKGKLGKIENKAIWSGRVVGKSVLNKIISLIKVAFGVVQACCYLIKKRPCCVVGFGGYASFPTALAAVVLRIPLIIHEQNSVMSRTNRVLAKFATLAAQSFREVKNTPSGVKSFLSGMPVRENIAALFEQSYKPRNDKGGITLIVLGGSQGAKVFAEAVPEAIKNLDEKYQTGMIVYQQCRKGEEDKVLSLYKNIKAQVVVKPFFENMAELYKKANVIISRAGASSVYEIAAVGLPSILVPLPSAADNHQYFNAKEFENNKAGVVMLQKDFDAKSLKNILEGFWQDEKLLLQMSKAAKKIAIVDAAKRLAEAVEKIKE